MRCQDVAAKTSSGDLAATGGEKTSRGAAERSLVVEHKGLCTRGAENRWQAMNSGTVTTFTYSSTDSKRVISI